eukprot:921724_1
MARSLYIVFQVHLIASTFSQTCDTPYQCVGKTIKKAQTGEIHINGYKAAIGATTSLSNNANTSSIIMCAGSFSCQGISPFTTSANVNCKSTRSCSNTSLQITNNGLAQCYGFQSCVFSTLTSVDASEIVCCGEQSCAYSRIFLANVLDGAGTHSLYLATIYSQGSSANIALQLTGKLAGYGATLICNAGHTCSITCLGHDSCYMFYADCVDNCVIVADGTIAPITNISELHIDAIDHNNADSMCNTHPNAITYDNNLQLLSSQITIQAGEEGPVCCRAREACSKSSITYASANTESVVCSGAWACKNALIDVNNGSVFCESADSCKFAQIDRSSCVYCKAFIACHTATITASRFIKCSGKESCINSIIHSGGTDLDLYLTGDNAGATATIYCNQNDWCNVRCIGYGSCTGTTLVCDGICNVYCDSISQCPQGWTSSPTVLPTPITTEPTLHPTVYPSVHPTNYPTVHPSSVPSVTPSDSPTKHPTTASPTQPGAILCGETSAGPYSRDHLIFETQIPFEGDLIFDARESSFQVTGIEMYTQLGSLLATDSDHDAVITIQVPSGDYRFIMMGNAQSNDTYHVNVGCVSDQPTSYPTAVPTKTPTSLPTQKPSYSPVNHPITPHPTKAPTIHPTQLPTFDHPITADPSSLPSANPTIDPTTSPTTDPISVSTETVEATAKDGKETESVVDNMVIWLVGAIAFLAFIICVLTVVVCYYRKHPLKDVNRAPPGPAIEMQTLGSAIGSMPTPGLASMHTPGRASMQTLGIDSLNTVTISVPEVGEVDGDARGEGEAGPQYVVSSGNMTIAGNGTTAITDGNDTVMPSPGGNREITVEKMALAYGNNIPMINANMTTTPYGGSAVTTAGNMTTSDGNVTTTTDNMATTAGNMTTVDGNMQGDFI